MVDDDAHVDSEGHGDVHLHGHTHQIPPGQDQVNGFHPYCQYWWNIVETEPQQ